MTFQTIPPNVDEGGKLKAIASGTLPSGQPVIVNSDGTVSFVAESTLSENTGTPAVFNTADSRQISAAYDVASGRVVIGYQNVADNNYGTAIVGTVSGTSISFGTPVVFESGTIDYINVVYDSTNNKVVFIYRYLPGGTITGEARVGTISASGTSISFGSRVQWQGSDARHMDSVFDPNTNQIITVFEESQTTAYGYYVIGSVSGTSISFGSSAVFHSAVSSYPYAVTYDLSQQKVVFAYRNSANSNYGTVIGGSVSGTSISFDSSSVVFASEEANFISMDYDSTAQKIVIAWNDGSAGGFRGNAIVGTVSPTSISFGSPVEFYNNQAEFFSVKYDPAADKTVISFRDNQVGGKGSLVVGTISGTSISFGPLVDFETGSTEDIVSTFDSNTNQIVIAYRDIGNTNYGTAAVFRNERVITNLTASNFIGFADGVVDEVAQNAGTAVVFEAASSFDMSSAYDSSNQKVVVAYRDDGNLGYGTAIVGTVSGTSISFGTPVVFESGVTSQITATYDSAAQKVAIIYRDLDNSNYGTGIVGTVSGTSISFGTPVVFNSADTRNTSSAYDSVNQKVVVAYRDRGAGSVGKSIVATVSGTSISFGTAVTFDTSLTFDTATAYDTNAQKIVIAYRDNNAPDYGTAIVGTVSGTSISFGNSVVFESASTTEISIAYDSTAQKMVITYQDGGNSSAGTAIVGTVSGTSISFGSPVVFNTGDTRETSAVYDTSTQKVVVAYRDAANSFFGTAVSGTVSGDSISFETPLVFKNTDTQYVSAVYDASAQRVVISYRDGGNLDYGTSSVFQTGYVTRGQVTDGNAAVVDIINTRNDNQLGLTTGAKYYVQTDGTLSTTPGTPSVFAGTAISATNILVKT